MNVVFDTNGNDKQKQVAAHWLDDSIDDIVYGGSKGSGKSYLGCSLIFGDAFIYPETHYFIARKALNDLRKYTIPSIHEVFSAWGINQKYYRYNGQDNFFTLHNGSKVFLIDAPTLPSDPLFQRFGSMQMTRGWIEEAGEFEEAAKNGIAVSLGRWKNAEYGLKSKLLQTCNPSKNYLYYNYYQRHKQDQLEHWKRFVQALPTDNKMLPEGYLEHLDRTLSKNEKERLLKGNWEYDDDPSRLIEYDAIIQSFANRPPDGKRIISCDVARFGKDKTVIGIWNGLLCEQIITIDKSDLTHVAQVLRKEASVRGILIKDVIVDEDGVGGGVVDMLRCRGFTANGTVEKVYGQTPNYANLKSQCAFKLAEMMNEGSIGIKETNTEKQKLIIEELEQLKQDRLEKDFTKLIIVGKDKMKEQLGRSPDYLDMLIMRMYYEIKPQVYVY